MNYKLAIVILVTLLAATLVGAVVVLADPPESNGASLPGSEYPVSRTAIMAQTQLTPTRFLTVTTTADDGGNNQRCEQGYECTLRRAINEVRYHMYDAETYRIAFDIGTGDDGYDATNGVWVIDVDSDNSESEVFAFRDFGTYGHLLIDGTTQPIGRALSVGPRIILRGDNQKGAFTLTGGHNIVRGMAFQGFGDKMVSVPGTSDNLIEENWFGLDVTGDEIYLRDLEDPGKGSGESGIYVQSGGSGNTVQDNVLTGFDQGAIAMDGDDSYVLDNWVGTRADGTVPAVRWNRLCHPNARYYNWFAGAGIQIYGHNHLVENNRVVGLLYYSDDPLSTSEDAISVTGQDHVVQNNVIGVDTGDQDFGTCGDGIHVGGSGGGHFIQVLTNLIVGSHGSAGVLLTGGVEGYDLDAVTVQSNVIEDSTNEAFAFGDTLPEELRLFNPAAVTSINGTSVSGTAGQGSPCAGCTVELFLDQVDMISETLESLAVVTANSNGNWTATLPRALALNEGIRTASTTATDGQIPHPHEPAYVYHAGTTTKLSELYVQTGAPDPTPAPSQAFETPLTIPAVNFSPQPTAPSSYTTVITVTTTDDPDDSESYVCYATGLVGKTPRLPCTLRQALVEADSLMDVNPGARPILIRFDISTSDDGYDGAGAWIIELYNTLKTTALPTLGSTDITKSGQVVIDGTTQPVANGLRANWPRIIVRGASGSKNGLTINGEGNVVKGLAFQRFKDILHLNHGGNIVEDNWFGLSVDGQSAYLRNSGQPQEGSSDGALVIADGADNNLVQNNVFLGATGATVNLEGSNDNYILNNYVGTRVNGTINVAGVDPANICDPTAASNNWFGGTGVNVRGKRNQVTDNVIVGLLVQGGDLQTPPNAITIPGEQWQDNLIQDNRIGRDATGADVWTCGRGLEITGRYTSIFSNTIVGTHLDAIFIQSGLIQINAVQVRGNVISDTVSAIEFGDLVPPALSGFEPARVTRIDDVDVTGTAGDDCPYCWVDVYLDDADDDVEALVFLGSATADADGDWSFTLPAPLAEGEGLRTISTIRNYSVIQYCESGTSSKLSDLYTEGAQVFLPLIIR